MGGNEKNFMRSKKVLVNENQVINLPDCCTYRTCDKYTCIGSYIITTGILFALSKSTDLIALAKSRDGKITIEAYPE